MSWAAWLATAALAAIGLPRYHISNSMDAWMPEIATAGPYASYVVIGFPGDRINSMAVAARLRALPAVALCLDSATVRAAQLVTGVSADDFVSGKEGIYSGIFCFRRDVATDRELIEQVQPVLDGLGPRESFALGGPAAFQQAMDHWSQDRLGLILGAILLCGGLMLWGITGSMRIAVVAMSAISISQIIFLGALCWLRIPMDMSLALVPPMMMGMGFSYAAHRALRQQSFVVLIACVVAAAAGIASFISADLLPVRHFAIAGVPGLLLVWLATVTLVRPDRPARRRRISWLRALRNLFLFASGRYRGLIIAIAMAITLAGLTLAPGLHVQADPLNFFPRTSRIARDFDTLNQRLTGMLPSQVIIHGRADPREILGQTPGMRKVIDITARTTDGQERTYWCLADNNAVNTLADHVPAWKSWATARGSTLEWHGVAAQIHRSGASILRLAAESLPSMATLIALIIAVLLRQVRAILIGVWVALVPVAALVIAATIADWELGPVALMIGSIAVGVAVDDALHLLTTFRRRQSMQRTLIECWKPCVGSSLAAMVCFSLFMLSPFGPTRQFGILMSLATGFAMLTNQLLLPALLRKRVQ